MGRGARGIDDDVFSGLLSDRDLLPGSHEVSPYLRCHIDHLTGKIQITRYNAFLGYSPGELLSDGAGK